MDTVTTEAARLGKPTLEPRVSVLIGVHNGLPFLEQAVRSIMHQSLREIEIIIVDDASTDGTADVLRLLAAEDPRILIETLAENHRLPRALNRGLELARSPYIARMDADDIAHPDRLRIQYEFLEDNPSIVLVGSSVRRIDHEGNTIKVSIRAHDRCTFRWQARFDMPIVHPTFMFRNLRSRGESVEYEPGYSVAEDYDFCVRMLEHGDVVALSEVLLDYRQHAQSISSTSWLGQRPQVREIAERHLRASVPIELLEELEAFREAFFASSCDDPRNVFLGLESMLAADVREFPYHSRWLRRQTAQLAYRAMERSGFSKFRIAASFLRYGRGIRWSMVERALESNNLLPRGLRSDPVVSAHT